jgi:hypothetical protein
MLLKLIKKQPNIYTYICDKMLIRTQNDQLEFYPTKPIFTPISCFGLFSEIVPTVLRRRERQRTVASVVLVGACARL